MYNHAKPNYVCPPSILLKRIILVSQNMALLIKKVRNCDGILMLQNNELASEQHALHYHLHIIPELITMA